MIKVDIKNSNLITISGHANYNDYGQDIVCASVSSIITTSINAMFMINSDAIDFSDENDIMKIILKEDNEVIKKLMINMITILKDLESQYPKNIKIIGGNEDV